MSLGPTTPRPLPRFAGILAFALAAHAAAQLPLNVNLVANPGFEQGLTGWTAVNGTFVPVAYGSSAIVPTLAFATHAGAGNGLLKANGGNATARQVFDLTGNAAAIAAGTLSLTASAYLGGYAADPDRARLRIRFLNQGGNLIRSDDVGPITSQQRNSETALQKAVTRVLVPPGSTAMHVEVADDYVSSGNGVNGMVDNVDVRLVTTAAPAALPLDTELVVNRDFESGWAAGSVLTPDNAAGWLGESGSSARANLWGTDTVPSLAFGNHIGGGQSCVQDQGGGAVLVQSFDVRGNAATIDAGNLRVRFGAWLGGFAGDPDSAQVDVEFLNLSGMQTGTATTDAVTRANRVQESVLLRVEQLVPVPAQTRRIVLRLRMNYVSSGNGANGCADNVSLKLTAAGVPTPPLNQELLGNGGFESGWNPGSVLTPATLSGWRGVTDASAAALPYGTSTMPPLAASTAIQGGGRAMTDVGGGAVLEQVFDLRGHATAIANGTLAVRLRGHLGGHLGDPDTTQLDALFQTLLGQEVATEVVGPVLPGHRNRESVLMRRERLIRIPNGSQVLRVRLRSNYVSSGNGANSCADNVSAMLVSYTVPTLPLGTNLVANPDFEAGWNPASPLQPAAAGSWGNSNHAAVQTVVYGTSATVPGTAVATQVNGGTRLVTDLTGGAVLEQRFDLRGLHGRVNGGTLGVHASAWLGGHAADPDSAQLNLLWLDANGAALGTPTVRTLGPVTAVDRANTSTLRFRDGTFTAPIGSVTMVVELQMNYLSSGNGANGCADNVAVVLFDTLAGGPLQFPGTGEDLVMSTSTGSEPPTAGPGYEIKPVTGGSIVNVRVDSLEGTFDFAPLLLAASLYPTGAPVVPMGGGIQIPLNQPWYLVVDGTTGVFGNALFPTGSAWQFLTPPALRGTVRLQAIALPLLAIPPFAPATPANGLFAASGAHELRF